MYQLLLVLGGVGFLASVISGFSAGGFWGIVVGIIGGVLSGGLFLGLATILEQQDILRDELSSLNRRLKESSGATLTICTKCGKEFDADLSSCTHCGKRS